jgi:hypothetical protein
MDPSSFEFFGWLLFGFPIGAIPTFSMPYVVFSGLPASSTVFVEAVLNLEVMYTGAHAQAPLYDGDKPSNQSLSNEWSNFEKMWSYVKEYLPAPGQAGQQAAEKLLQMRGPLLQATKALRFVSELRRKGRYSYANNLFDAAADSFLSL